MPHEIFLQTDKQYGNGIMLEEYNGVYSLVRAAKSQNGGTVWKKWGFPQDKDRKPIEKGIPWKIELGDAIQAPKVLEYFLEQLRPGHSEPVAEGDEEVPF